MSYVVTYDETDQGNFDAEAVAKKLKLGFHKYCYLIDNWNPPNYEYEPRPRGSRDLECVPDEVFRYLFPLVPIYWWDRESDLYIPRKLWMPLESGKGWLLRVTDGEDVYEGEELVEQRFYHGTDTVTSPSSLLIDSEVCLLFEGLLDAWKDEHKERLASGYYKQ